MMIEPLRALAMASRGLRRAPLYSAALALLLTITGAAIGLALVLGRTLAAHPLPYRDPDQLVTVMGSTNEACGSTCLDLFSVEQFHFLRAASRGFEKLVSYRYHEGILARDDDARRVAAALVGTNFFTVLGAPAERGRTLLPGDDDPGAAPAAVLAHSLWRRAFGADPAIVGQQIILFGRVFTVVGIMPTTFAYPMGTEVWLPGTAVPAETSPALTYESAVGRLRPHVSLEQARAELRAVARQFHGQLAGGLETPSLTALPLAQPMSSEAPYAEVLAGALALLGIVLFAGLQSLVIVRVLDARPTLAIRLALGATKLQALQPLWREAALLTATCSATAVVLAAAIVKLAAGIPRLGLNNDLALDASIALGVVLGSAAVMALVAIPPSLLVARAAQGAVQATAAHLASPPPRAVTLRKLAIGLEIGLGLVFLCVAVTLGRSIGHLRSAELGYDRRGLTVAPLDLRDTPLDETTTGLALADRILGELSVVQDVRSAAAWSVAAPSMMVRSGEAFATIEGGITTLRYGCRHPSDCSFPMLRYGVSDGFFATTGIAITAGRGFNASDGRGGLPVAVISQQAATHWWPGLNPLGRRFKLGPVGSPYPWLTVVGVAANSQPIDEWGVLHGAEHPGQFYPLIFQPLRQVELGITGRPAWTASLLVGMRADPRLHEPARALRQALRRAAPTVPLGRVASLEDVQLANGLFDGLRLGGQAAAFACGLAVLLALISVATLVVEGIRARTREFGIRLAIGATPSAIRRLAANDAIVLTGTSVATAAAAVVAGNRLLARWFYGATERYREGILYGTMPATLPTVLLAGLFLAMLVLLCVYLAARRIDRLDLSAVLRTD